MTGHKDFIPAASSRTADKFVVRLPEGMRDRVCVVARTNGRSMNSEILTRLHDSLYCDDVSAEQLTHDKQNGEIISALALKINLIEDSFRTMPSPNDPTEFVAWQAKMKSLLT